MLQMKLASVIEGLSEGDGDMNGVNGDGYHPPQDQMYGQEMQQDSGYAPPGQWSQPGGMTPYGQATPYASNGDGSW